jgi:hypothetical protein
VRDYKVLLHIQSFFGGIGLIHYSSNSVTFRVNKLTDLLNVIIPHFMKYQLLSEKYADFKLFVKIIHLLNEKAHLNAKGLQQIVNIKASLNRGSSDFLTSYYSKIEPVTRETKVLEEITDPH